MKGPETNRKKININVLRRSKNKCNGVAGESARLGVFSNIAKPF
jgi:hypothetical protein